MKFLYNLSLAVLLLSSFSLSATNITFQVDMGSTTVSGDGVSVAYAPPTAMTLADVTIVALDDADGDGIYSGVSDVPDDEIGYFFINGAFANPLNYETVPEECGEEIMLVGLSTTVRTYLIDGEATLPAVCFSECGPCAVTDCNDPMVLISDDASAYELGNLGENGHWGLWPGAGLGIEIDTFNGDNVFSIIGDPAAQDVVLITGDLTSGHYMMSWDMYIPAGNTAYFNVQHQLPDAAGGYWAFDVYFNGDGAGELELYDDFASVIDFEYLEDEFFNIIIFIDLDNDEARLIVGEYTVAAWKFSDGITNGSAEFDLLQLSGVNFYPINATDIWFFDNVTLSEIPSAGVGQYCYTATTIEPGVHTASDLACFGGGMHHDDGDGLAGQWFQYTPTEDGWISIGSCGGGADTRGWILTGECHDLDIVGVNDDQCPIEEDGSEWASYREATVVGGQTYYIMWDNTWDDIGFDFELTFNTSDLVTGDFCESALDIQPGTYDILEFTGNAAMTGPIIDNTSQGRSPTPYAMTEWYQYTPAVDGMMTITSCEGSASDNRVWVYTGQCGTLSSLTLVATNDDGCEEGFASMITDFPVVGGTTYYIEWDNGWDSDAFSWDLIFSAPSANITFQVDMNLSNISPDGVFVAGSFSNFDNVAMDDSDVDGIYTVTVGIDQGSDIEYKFKNGPDGWEDIDISIGDNCATGEFGNRVLSVGTEDITIDAVCFNYCVACELVDIDELTFEQSVKLFPNPTSGQLQLNIQLPETIKNLELRVVSMLGATVMNRQLGSASLYNETVDMRQLPTGTYIVQLTSGELQMNRKVIVR